MNRDEITTWVWLKYEHVSKLTMVPRKTMKIDVGLLSHVPINVDIKFHDYLGVEKSTSSIRHGVSSTLGSCLQNNGTLLGVAH